MFIDIPVRALHHFAKNRSHVLNRHLNSLQLDADYRNQNDNNKDDDHDNEDDNCSSGKWGHIEADATWSGMVAQVLTNFPSYCKFFT